MSKRIISIFLVLVTVIFIAFPLNAFAIDDSGDDDEYIQKSTFWSSIMENSVNDDGTVSGFFGFCSIFSKDTCFSSSNLSRLHNGGLKSRIPNADQSFTAVCKYCGYEWSVYDADMHDAYYGYVDGMKDDIGTPIITDDGLLYPILLKNFSAHNSTSYSFKELTGTSFKGDYNITSNFKGTNPFQFDFARPFDVVPISGYYSLVTPRINVTVYGGTYGINFANRIYVASGNGIIKADSPIYLSSGTALNTSSVYRNYIDITVTQETSSAYFELFIDGYYCKVIPNQQILDNYGTGTRAGSMTGNYGIMGENGKVISAGNNVIVNEDNKTVYNPVTNETYNIRDWIYDYSDRSYNITLEDGSEMKVVYGDENITIHNGDNIYNIYYVTEGNGSGGNGGGGDNSNSGGDGHTHDYKPTVLQEPTCKKTGSKKWTCSKCGDEYTEKIAAKGHDYTSETTQEPTCKNAGLELSTCSVCGDKYTDKIAASGHVWAVGQTVSTSYDEEGNLVQQGYTIYRCTVCGEEYKDIEGKGPPTEESGNIFTRFFERIFSAIVGFIEALVGFVVDLVLEVIVGLIEKVFGLLSDIINSLKENILALPALFSGFSDLLGEMFSFLPTEVLLIITFGVLATVLLSLIVLAKKIIWG